MNIGDRMSIGWGEPGDPQFHRVGEVIAWVQDPGRPDDLSKISPVIRLDEPVTQEGQVQFQDRRETPTGSFLVLGLRYVDQTWDSDQPVHVSLYTGDPRDPLATGVWIAAHGGWSLI